MHRLRTPRLAVATVALIAASLAACGGDGDSEGSGGDVESFCAALGALEDVVSDVDDPDPFVEGLVRVDDAAPDDISADTAAVKDFVERSAEISKMDADEQAAAIEEFGALQGDFDVAVRNVEDYARDNCPDLGESFFGS